MRIDARNLLDRLGRSDFAYKEFEDRFTDLELWPILEALLRDPRLQALDPAVPQKAPPASALPSDRLDAAATPTTEPAAEPLKSLFSRYEQDASAAPTQSEAVSPPKDVRGLLRRLSGEHRDENGRGEN
ncbi:hypothetical protein WBP06_22485 [Novosphingobium sp. BL-8H]|uniref:hypothetical protein n=1 Tax=Novosphingobium sp. BL-8H TaxID=3127640 RepID=UPI0037574B8F